MAPELTEFESNPATTIEGLQAGRRELAYQSSVREMYRTLAAPHNLDRFSVLTRLENAGIPTDTGALDTRDLIALEVIGADTDAILTQTGIGAPSGGKKAITSLEVGSDHLEILPYGEGITTILSSTDPDFTFKDKKRSDKISAGVEARLGASPAHQAFKQMETVFSEAAEKPETLHSETFDPTRDPLATMALLQNVGLLSSMYSPVRNMRAGLKPIDALATELNNLSADKILINDNEATTSFSWGKGVQRRFTIDKKTGLCNFDLSLNPEAEYNEVANQAWHIEAKPFVETECAAELTNVLDNAGLMFHPRIQAEMMRAGEADRYGAIYTQLSREISKWVNKPDRTKMSNLFVPKDEAFAGPALAQSNIEDKLYEYEYDRDRSATDVEAQVRQAFQKADKAVTGEAAATLLALAESAIKRPTEGELPSDLLVGSEDISMRDGSCFDVAAYYIGAASSAKQGNSAYLKHISVGKTELLEKTNGKHTYMSTNELVFNGVTLPAGTLFGGNEEKGFSMLRLTPFAFDKPADQEAAGGSELAKAYEQQMDAIQRIGGSTLSHLIESATDITEQ